ncbi:MAG TPA: hypothetical protein VN765_07965 [Candidatus Acidoferrum sp.]|nr:hypothetical protein [Candidatus Acidoferrum sp.]
MESQADSTLTGLTDMEVLSGDTPANIHGWPKAARFRRNEKQSIETRLGLNANIVDEVG